MESRYTVVGVYDDEGATVTRHVMAEDPEAAIRAFWVATDEEYGENVSVVDVFEGHLDSVMPFSTWVDHPNSGGCVAP